MPEETSPALPTSILREMAILKHHRTKRVSSYDRSGRNHDWITIEPGQTTALAYLPGVGCINRFYAIVRCLDHMYLRKVIIRAYWDGETSPSIEVPFGDFFGCTNGTLSYFSSLALAVNPGGYGPNVGDGFNCFLPMPFEDGMRLEITNQSEISVECFWYHIDYEEFDSLDPSVGRLHAQWRRESTTKPVPQPAGRYQGANLSGEANFVVLDASGHGNFAGFVLGVDNFSGDWWGEGDDMIFVDGEGFPPAIHGTGTEEIFGGGACPNVPYAGSYMGIHQISDLMWSGKNGMYRFYVNDPIRFEKSIKVSIEHGHNNDLANDYSSVAYWYQSEPHGPFPPLPALEARLPHMPDEYWRLAEQERPLSARYFKMGERMPDKQRRIIGVQYRGPFFQALSSRDYRAAEENLARFRAALDEFSKFEWPEEHGEGAGL